MGPLNKILSMYYTIHNLWMNINMYARRNQEEQRHHLSSGSDIYGVCFACHVLSLAHALSTLNTKHSIIHAHALHVPRCKCNWWRWISSHIPLTSVYFSSTLIKSNVHQHKNTIYIIWLCGGRNSGWSPIGYSQNTYALQQKHSFLYYAHMNRQPWNFCSI